MVVERGIERTLKAFKGFKARRLAMSLSMMERTWGTRGPDLGSLLAQSVVEATPRLFPDTEAFKTSLGKAILNSDEYVTAADEIIRHRFDLLGSGKKDVSETAEREISRAAGEISEAAGEISGAAEDISGAGSKAGSKAGGRVGGYMQTRSPV